MSEMLIAPVQPGNLVLFIGPDGKPAVPPDGYFPLTYLRKHPVVAWAYDTDIVCGTGDAIVSTAEGPRRASWVIRLSGHVHVPGSWWIEATMPEIGGSINAEISGHVVVSGDKFDD